MGPETREFFARRASAEFNFPGDFNHAALDFHVYGVHMCGGRRGGRSKVATCSTEISNLVLIVLEAFIGCSLSESVT